MNRKFQITEYRIASEFFDGNDRPVRWRCWQTFIIKSMEKTTIRFWVPLI